MWNTHWESKHEQFYIVVPFSKGQNSGIAFSHTLVRQNVCSRGSFWFMIFCSWKGRCTQTCFKKWQIEYGRRCEWITEFRNRNGLMAGTSDWSGQISPALIQCLRWCKTEWAACTPCLKTEKLKYWKTEKSQIPWKQGLTPHTKAYRRWYLSATTHCEYLTKRSLSVHITEIVRATNSVLDRTEMNIYELNELDSSVRSNAIGGFRLKWLFFQKHQHKSREVKMSATSSSSTGLP